MTGLRDDTSWWHEWGALCLVALVALPLFTPRVYASDEIKYFATLRSVYFDQDLHYENEYGHFIRRDPVAHDGLRPFRDGVTPTGSHFASSLSIALALRRLGRATTR